MSYTTNSYVYRAKGRRVGKVTARSPSVSYRSYGCHFNRNGQFAEAGTGSFQVGNEQSFDAWGAPSAIGTAYPESSTNAKYCANLGHKHDDESSLIYMRARYYEPGSGRFICEDPDRKGWNWMCYCHSDPANYKDRTGRDELSDVLTAEALSAGIEGGYNITGATAYLENNVLKVGIDKILQFNPQVAGNASIFVAAINSIAQKYGAFAVDLKVFISTDDGMRWFQRMTELTGGQLSKDEFWTQLYWLVLGDQ